MRAVEILCRMCRRSWLRHAGISLYEEQAVETRPCPRCGAYTLSCRDAGANKADGNMQPALPQNETGAILLLMANS